MKRCVECGKEFDVSYVRRVIGARFGAGLYNEYFPEGDVCEDCATDVIGPDVEAGMELKDLMGSSWDD